MNNDIIKVLIEQHTVMIETHKRLIEELKKLKTSECSKKSTKKRYEQMTWKNQHKVKCIETGKIYDSVRQAARENFCGGSNIISCCKGSKPHVKGLHWEYVE